MQREPVACGDSALGGSEQGETFTASDPGLRVGFKIVAMLVRLQYLVLAPWIVFGISSLVSFGLQVPTMLTISAFGLLGMLGKKEIFARGASLSLVGFGSRYCDSLDPVCCCDFLHGSIPSSLIVRSREP